MKTSLDCIPCILRQALDAARLVSPNQSIHEQIIREVLGWTKEMDLSQSTPVMAQRIHRRLREITGASDPYREIKEQHNQIAMALSTVLRPTVESSPDPLLMAARLAIAGNAIDMGVIGYLSEKEVQQAVNGALKEPFYGNFKKFRVAVKSSKSILYLADNAGEIALDRLLVEQIGPRSVTFVVRGAPVINDATLVDARAVFLDRIVEVIDNGSDAPGTILEDCTKEFRDRFAEADMVIVKGQGNFESLNNEPGNLFFLFKVKCPVIADHVMQPVGTHMLLAPGFLYREASEE